MADRAVPGHLGEPDRDLRSAAVAAAAHDPDRGRGHLRHRRHRRGAGSQGPAGRRLPGRSPADRADVPGHGVARPPPDGRDGGAAGRDGGSAAGVPGEPATAPAAAPVPPGRLARTGHADHGGARSRGADGTRSQRHGDGRGRPGGGRRAAPAGPAGQPDAAARLVRPPGFPAHRAGRRGVGARRRAGTLGLPAAPLAAGPGHPRDRAGRPGPAGPGAGRAAGERDRAHRRGRPDRGQRAGGGPAGGPDRHRLRAGHRAGRPAAHLPPVRPGQQPAQPRSGRLRAGPGHCAGHHGGAPRLGPGAQHPGAGRRLRAGAAGQPGQRPRRRGPAAAAQ